MSRKISKHELVLNIFEPDEKTGISNWKTREELENTGLSLGNNGNTRHGTCFGVNEYEWDIKRKNNTHSGKIEQIRTSGFNSDIKSKRTISNKIRDYYKGCSCVVCGTKDIIIDHKNDLYNDTRVLDVKTQTIEDFQPLCNSCNLRKRSVCKQSKESGKRYGATNIPMLEIYGIDFIKGDETLDIHNPKAMEGTYWHDPVAFIKSIKSTNCLTTD